MVRVRIVWYDVNTGKLNHEDTSDPFEWDGHPRTLAEELVGLLPDNLELPAKGPVFSLEVLSDDD